MKKIPQIPSANSDTWNNAEGKQNGLPSLIRYRPNLGDYLGLENYSKRLVIFWDYDGHSSNGMPCDEESNRMKKLEDILVSVLDYDRTGILVLIYTCSGTREWHFYVSEIDEVQHRINERLRNSEVFPIQLQVENDSSWEKLSQVYSLFS